MQKIGKKKKTFLYHRQKIKLIYVIPTLQELKPIFFFGNQYFEMAQHYDGMLLYAEVVVYKDYVI